MKKIRVIYFGYDIETLFLLAKDSNFEIKAIAIIQDFITYKTSNIIDILFKKVYKLHIEHHRNSNLKKLLLHIFNQFSYFSSPLYKKYKIYINFIIDNNIKLYCNKNIEEGVKDNIDLFLVNNWWILPEVILNKPKYGCINIHPSKLSQYRGSVPTLWSLKNRDRISAVSYILLNENIDTGKIINQHDFSISQNDNSLDIECKVETIVKNTLLKDIKKYLTEDIVPYKQEEKKSSKTELYYRYMRIKPHEENAMDIYNKVILYPYLYPIDQCYLLAQNKKFIYINSCFFSNRKLSAGEYQIYGFNLYLGCKNNSIKLYLFKDINFINSLLFIFNLIKL